MGKLKALSCVAGLVLGLVGQAQAAAVVTSWSSVVTSTWTSATGATISNANRTLSWGDDDQSHLIISNSPVGTAVVNTYIGGGSDDIPNSNFYWGTGSTITHENNPITGSNFTAATLTASLALTPNVPVAEPNPSLSAAINIAFLETPNSGQAQNCAVPTSPSACNDIFVVLGGLGNQTFTYDGLQYFVSFFPSNDGAFTLLAPTACAAVLGAGNTVCIGFSTAERNDTIVPFSFTVSTEQRSITDVPEPGIVALVGLALAAGAFARRRRS